MTIVTDDKTTEPHSESFTREKHLKSSKEDITALAHRKPCDLCQTPSDVLVRCRTDETQVWHFVCTGKCWKRVSGGVQDGPDKPYYQYGGMWKNKHAGVSAKKPKKQKKKGSIRTLRPWSPEELWYVVNDKVLLDGVVWVCRRSHHSGDSCKPGLGYTYWKEDQDGFVEEHKVEGETGNIQDNSEFQ